MVRKNFISCCHNPAPRADKIQRQGQGLSGHWTHGGLVLTSTWQTTAGKERAARLRRKRTQSRHQADTWWRRGKVGSRRTLSGQSRPKRSQGRRMADARRTLKADTWRRKCGDAAKADSRLTAHKRGTQTRFGGGRPKRTQSGHQDRRPTQAGHIVDKAWGCKRLKANALAGGHMADKSRTRFGGVAKADARRTHGGHIADKPRGRGQRIGVNCLGNK